jgi:type IV pilus assembly protein PilN
VEIVAATVALTPRDQRRVAKFTIKVRLVRASEAAKAAKQLASASAPFAVASAAVQAGSAAVKN